MSGELPLFPGLPVQVRGSPDGASGMVDRLWRAIEARLSIDPSLPREEACWLCTYAVNGDGYAVKGRYGSGDLLTAHYISYVRHHGPVPDGFQVMHKCDVRRCVNPGHLRAGRHWQNMADMKAKRRGGGARVKAKPCELLFIDWTSGLSQAEIARRLGRSLWFVNRRRVGVLGRQ